VEKQLTGPTIVLGCRVMPNLLHGLHQQLTHSCRVPMCIISERTVSVSSNFRSKCKPYLNQALWKSAAIQTGKEGEKGSVRARARSSERWYGHSR